MRLTVSLIFAAFVVAATMLTFGPPLRPFLVRTTVHDTIFVTRTIPLRVDTVHMMDRAGNPSCALPAVVTSVSRPEHANLREPTPHGHYRVQAGEGPAAVLATPPNAKPGDVVCVLVVD